MEIPFGCCQCGCGEQTTVYKGKTRRFITGHSGRGRRLRQGPDIAIEDRGYETPCHIWQHGLSGAGYGRMTMPWGSKPRQQYTHIVEWEKVNGPVPVGLELDHLCRQRDCCNAEHLEAVPHRVNLRRSPTLGVVVAELSRSKTHCPDGHPYDGANLYTVGGKRHCRACRSEAKKRHNAKLKAERAARAA